MTYPEDPRERAVIGVVGGGWAARRHLEAWRKLGVPVVLHARGQRGAQLADGAENVQPVRSMTELLAAVTIVDICTPTDTHVELADQAISAGKHVICEKPLARDQVAAAALAARADHAGVRLLPAHVVRWVPAYRALAEAVRSGQLGTIATARFTRTTATPTWSDWFADEARSGGIIMDQMIHDLDQALQTLGPARQVQARRTRGEHTTSATVILRHDDTRFSHVTGTWGPEQTGFRTSYRVVGSAGVIEHDSARSASLRLRGSSRYPDNDAARALVDDFPNGHGSPFVPQLEEFLTAITSGRPARIGAADAVAAVAVAEAALESARTGRPVEVSS